MSGRTVIDQVLFYLTSRAYAAEREHMSMLDASAVGREAMRHAHDLKREMDRLHAREQELLEANNRAVEERRKIVQISNENHRALWAALMQIREAVETLGPVGAVAAGEHLETPKPHSEAEAIIGGIRKMADQLEALRRMASADCR